MKSAVPFSFGTLCKGASASILTGLALASSFSASAATLSYPQTLSPGWNMIGNSLNTSINVQSTFGSASTIQTIWKWDSIGGKWAFFAPSMDALKLKEYADSKGYAVLSSIEPGEGYWVSVSGVSAIDRGVLSGEAAELTASKLKQGWNLVASGSDVSPANLSAGIGNITTLWAWDNSQSAWYFYAPSLASNNTLANYIQTKNYKDFGTLTLGKGLGFWVNYGAAVSYTISGNASGIGAGMSVVLQNNAADDLTVSANGGFSFSVPVSSSGNYAVTVKTQPAGQTCTVGNASGTANAPISGVVVTCNTNQVGGGGGSGGVVSQYPITASVDWSLCDGGVARAQGGDWVSNSNCIAGAVTYSGLNEAQAYVDSMRITEGFNGGWNYIDGDRSPVKEGYLLNTARCNSAIRTLRSVGGGLRGDQLFVRAPVGNQASVVELTGGRNRDLTALFPVSISSGVWSCN